MLLLLCLHLDKGSRPTVEKQGQKENKMAEFLRKKERQSFRLSVCVFVIYK